MRNKRNKTQFLAVYSYFVDKVHLPAFSGVVIACKILNDRLGIALPVYFFGSGACCSLGGTYCCCCWAESVKSKGLRYVILNNIIGFTVWRTLRCKAVLSRRAVTCKEKRFLRDLVLSLWGFIFYLKPIYFA